MLGQFRRTKLSYTLARTKGCVMFWQVVKDDYRRHGSSSSNPAFIALFTYRFGRWVFELNSSTLKYAMWKIYRLLNFFVANFTKAWIPPAVQIGADFHIISAEGSLSIHPNALIGDRLGVMHNVTIGTNMGLGTPR